MPLTTHRADVAIRGVTVHSTRADIIAALMEVRHEAGRVMANDPRHKKLHGVIDQLLDLIERQDVVGTARG